MYSKTHTRVCSCFYFEREGHFISPLPVVLCCRQKLISVDKCRDDPALALLSVFLFFRPRFFFSLWLFFLCDCDLYSFLHPQQNVKVFFYIILALVSFISGRNTQTSSNDRGSIDKDVDCGTLRMSLKRLSMSII